MEAVKQNVSLSATDSFGNVAAIMINGWVTKNDGYDPSKYRHEQSRNVAKLFHDAYEKADLFNKYNVDRIFEFKILAVDPK